jgi:hypothetical protein
MCQIKTNVDQFLKFGPILSKFFDKLYMHIISGVQFFKRNPPLAPPPTSPKISYLLLVPYNLTK